MEDQYEMGDLRQCINGRPLLPPPISQPPDLLSGHSGFTAAQHYEAMLMLPRGLPHEFLSDSTTSVASFKSASTGGGSSIGAVVGGFDMDAVGFNGGGSGGDIGGNGRWPRQETLTLLEIRSRLDNKFKEANQKGPLWDEVSRIMSEEHGYQRSGKKCREKFENLYKYYKKTKEGKAGRQDGKHYRFFRQLEALYGETNNNAVATASEAAHVINYKPSNETRINSDNNNNNCSLSLSNSSDFNTTSSDDSEDDDNSTNKSNKRKKVGGKRGWKAKIREFIDSQMSKLMVKQEAWMEKMMTTIEFKEQERLLREEEWRKQDAERIEREQKFWANERAWIQGRDAVLMEALRKLNGKELSEVTEIQNLNNNNNNSNVVKNNDEVNDYLIEANYRRRENHTSRLNENGMNDLCLRYFMGDGDNTWDNNYGQKSNKGYK